MSLLPASGDQICSFHSASCPHQRTFADTYDHNIPPPSSEHPQEHAGISCTVLPQIPVMFNIIFVGKAAFRQFVKEKKTDPDLQFNLTNAQNL